MPPPSDQLVSPRRVIPISLSSISLPAPATGFLAAWQEAILGVLHQVHPAHTCRPWTPPMLAPRSSGPPCLQPRPLTGKAGGTLTLGAAISVLLESGVHPHPLHETQPVSGGRREGGGGGRFPVSPRGNGHLRRNPGRIINAFFWRQGLMQPSLTSNDGLKLLILLPLKRCKYR